MREAPPLVAVTLRARVAMVPPGPVFHANETVALPAALADALIADGRAVAVVDRPVVVAALETAPRHAMQTRAASKSSLGKSIINHMSVKEGV